MTAWDYLLPKTVGYQPKADGTPAGQPPSGSTIAVGSEIDWKAWRIATADRLTISADEASELARFTAHTYINPNDYPALYALVRRLAG